MPTNIIAFIARPSQSRAAIRPQSNRDNVISLATWLDRAVPRRTPNGVFFTTRVLATSGDIA